jgi:FtsP/CotA-like multicopper oxidase with cupredoxin domain
MNVRRMAGLVTAALALGLVAAACGSGGSSSTNGGTVEVTLQEFSISPSRIDVAAGEPTTVKVMNHGQVPHSFAVDLGGRMIETSLISAGQSATLELPALDAGSYSGWCTVAGHKEAGMTATVVSGEIAAGANAGDGPASGNTMSGMSGDEMAKAHETSTKAFPATTEGLGNQVLQPTMDGNVKVFAVTAKQVRWEVSPGVFQDAFTYNGTVPGPQIRVRQGDHIRVVLENQFSQPTVIHFHGVTVPNAMDGVPYITQDPVFPGASFVYEFTVVNSPGTYLYHSHFNSAEQVGRGLFGAFIVEPSAPSWDVEYTELISDGSLGYTIDGKSFPATQPLTAKLGQDVLIRLANAGELLHPFHLHGYHFMVIAQDGERLTAPYKADTLVVAPGETFEVLVHADQPGAWAFHCHILSHVEGPEGMFGMVTALIVS